MAPLKRNRYAVHYNHALLPIQGHERNPRSQAASAKRDADDPLLGYGHVASVGPAAILAKVQRLKSILEASRKVQKAFAVRTTNEIDELFTKVDARVQANGQEAGLRRQRRSFTPNGSVTLFSKAYKM